MRQHVRPLIQVLDEIAVKQLSLEFRISTCSVLVFLRRDPAGLSAYFLCCMESSIRAYMPLVRAPCAISW